MKQALDNLRSQICTLKPIQPITDDEYKKFVDNCVVVLMSGGESSRFREVSNTSDANKNAFKLPNGDTMIEMTIRMYKEGGFKNFVVLAYHQAKSLEDILGNGEGLGVNISFSYDPGPVGKGGAIRNAFEKGFISNDNYIIIHNPDDMILNYEGSFPKYVVSGHLQNETEGSVATVVIVEETPYSYTGMNVVNNKVTQIEMYPMVPIPTHIGVTIMSPGTYNYFLKNFDYSKKSDFEKVLFPILSSEGKLSAVSIPEDNWLAVNNLKAYNKLLQVLNISDK